MATKTSVTNFIHCNGKYLLLKRREDAAINPGKINGTGGKVEPMEDYVSAVIRETYEETGYVVSEEDINFCGFIKFEEGYEDQWLTAYFRVEVRDVEVPIGLNTREGELFWMPADEVLARNLDLIDDLNYIFEDIVHGRQIFFMTVRVEEEGSIIEKSVRKLQLRGKRTD